jgi:Arylsulfotransferase (ASST)
MRQRQDDATVFVMTIRDWIEAHVLRELSTRLGPACLSPRDCQDGISHRLSRLVVTFICLMFIASCDFSQPSSSDQHAPQASEGPLQANVQVTTQPALTPSFQPSIQDYVIDCNSSPEVQFTAQMGGGATVFIDDAPVAALGQTAQATFTLVAGQRFTFAFSSTDTPLEYSVRCLPAGFPPISRSIAAAPQAQWYVFSPSLGGTQGPYFVIVTDSNGTPVWWMAQSGGGTPVDAKIIGQNIVWTVADGSFTFRSFDGEVQSTLGPGLDDHELQLTPAGTYLVIRTVQRVCPPDCADMSPWGGSAQAAVLDAEILEMDSGSNVLWTWRTRDHITLAESGTQPWFPSVGNDIIHMNAIEPDGEGALLFSARHLDAIYHVTKSTGSIDWKLGGLTRPESLTVIGDTRPTAIGPSGQVLSGQHDVRLLTDGTVTVHDNGTDAGRPPYAMHYAIYKSIFLAEVVEAIQDPRVNFSNCCGSARRLPGGDWVVQWGGNPFMTELDPSGNPVLTISYNLGGTFSYRAQPILPGVVSADQLRQGMDAMAPPRGTGRIR